MLDHVCQLADVARPDVAHQQLHGRRTEQLLVLNGILAESSKEVDGQLRNIASPLAQRRQANFERIDAKHQILAKLAALDHLFQITVGRADHPHIDLERIVVTHPTHFAALQHPQQLRLHGQGKFADFIQEDRPTRGDFEQPFARIAPVKRPSYDQTARFQSDSRAARRS